MSLVIELPASLEAELTAESERLGVSISEVVVKRISNHHNSDQFEKPKNGKELVQNWRKHGIPGSRPDISDSNEYARSLRTESETRIRD